MPAATSACAAKPAETHWARRRCLAGLAGVGALPRAGFGIEQVDVVGMHSWKREPFIAGCRQVSGAGDVTRWIDAMSLPHERLHFGGEHTRRLEIDMEAAMESGERAALEILGRTGA